MHRVMSRFDAAAVAKVQLGRFGCEGLRLLNRLRYVRIGGAPWHGVEVATVLLRQTRARSTSCIRSHTRISYSAVTPSHLHSMGYPQEKVKVTNSVSA